MSKVSDNLDKTVFEYLVELTNEPQINLQLQVNLNNGSNILNIANMYHSMVKKEQVFMIGMHTCNNMNIFIYRDIAGKDYVHKMWKVKMEDMTNAEILNNCEIITPSFKDIFMLEYYNKHNIFCTIELDLDREIPLLIANEVNYNDYIIKIN